MSASHNATEVIGADISQREIVLAWARPERPRRTIANSRPAIVAWLKQLPTGCVIGMEATGRLHQLLADLATLHGHTVYVINPKRLALYAKGVGQRAKTDALDARSPDAAKRNPGWSIRFRNTTRISLALHPGYGRHYSAAVVSGAFAPAPYFWSM